MPYSFIPRYRSPFPASQMFYTPPSYSYFLPLPTQITKINSAEIITPNVTRYSEPSVIRSSVDLLEDPFNITDNELILNNSDSNAYLYEPLLSLDTDNNDENVPNLNLIFKKLLESSKTLKQLNTGERSPYTDKKNLLIRDILQGNYTDSNSLNTVLLLI